MSDLQKAFAIADEWEGKYPLPKFDESKGDCYCNEHGNQVSRLEFAFGIAESLLEAQGTPIRNGGIEISFSFLAEWGIDTEHERTTREMCNAWTLDGGEPRAFMANVRGEQDDESNGRAKVHQGRGSRANLDTAQRNRGRNHGR